MRCRERRWGECMTTAAGQRQNKENFPLVSRLSVASLPGRCAKRSMHALQQPLWCPHLDEVGSAQHGGQQAQHVVTRQAQLGVQQVRGAAYAGGLVGRQVHALQ